MDSFPGLGSRPAGFTILWSRLIFWPGWLQPRLEPSRRSDLPNDGNHDLDVAAETVRVSGDVYALGHRSPSLELSSSSQWMDCRTVHADSIGSGRAGGMGALGNLI